MILVYATLNNPMSLDIGQAVGTDAWLDQIKHQFQQKTT